MNWFDWLIIIVFILTHLWTVRRFSGSSPGLGTSPARPPEAAPPRETHAPEPEQEVEAIQGVMVRLAAENMQWEKKYSRLEGDYQTAITKLNELTAKLERRTHALEACRKLLAGKQGIEDSGEIDV